MEEIEAAAHAARADELIEKLPQHYRTVIGDGGARLSVGEKQRINLARAFLKDAPILLMDEPTSALDVESEAQVVASLFALMRGRTTLMVAHRLTTIRRVDKILVVDERPPDRDGRPRRPARRAGLLRAGGQRPARPLSLGPHRTPRSRSAASRSLCWRSRSRAARSRSHLAQPFASPSSPRPRCAPTCSARATGAWPLGNLGRPRQARIGALEVLRRGREGLAELPPLRPFRSPLVLDDLEVLALLSGPRRLNALASPDALPAASARLLAFPPPFREPLIPAIRSLVILSARFSWSAGPPRSLASISAIRLA